MAKDKDGDFWNQVQAASRRSEERSVTRSDGSKAPVHYQYSNVPYSWQGDGKSAKPASAPCHPHNAIREIAGRAIYCAASPDAAHVIGTVEPKLVLDCRNSDSVLAVVAPARVAAGPRSLHRLVARSLPKPPAVIRIAWPDFQLPPLGAQFFLDLARWLRGAPVVCVCMGGHGRSGTAAASLLAAYGVEHPVKLVRASHCKKAIETKEQEAFVHSVTELQRKR